MSELKLTKLIKQSIITSDRVNNTISSKLNKVILSALTTRLYYEYSR